MNKAFLTPVKIVLAFYFFVSPILQVLPFYVSANAINSDTGSELINTEAETKIFEELTTDTASTLPIDSPEVSLLEGEKSAKHTIEVCFVNLDEKGQVLNNLPVETTIEFPVYLNPVMNSNTGLPNAYGTDKINFEMNEKTDNNTHLWSPTGKNDAYCDRYEIPVETDTEREAYTYGEAEISDPLNDWFQTRYHDGYQTDFAHPNDAERYSGELFRIPDGQGEGNIDIDGRENLSDGHINMYGSNDERRIVVVNKIEKRVFPKVIEVCFANIDSEGNFVDGNYLGNGTNFEIDLYADLIEGENGLPAENESKIFKTVKLATPYENNTQIFSDVNDAFCKKVEFANKGRNIGYSQASVDTNHSIYLPKYSDGFSGKVASVNQLYNYSPELFDGIRGNENDRNQDSDGHIIINENGNPRRLIILNSLNQNSFIGEINVVDKYGEDIDGIADDFGNLNTEYLNEDTVDSKKYWTYKIKNNNPAETKYVRFSWDGFNWEPQGGFGGETTCPGDDITAEDQLCNIWNGEEVKKRSYGPEKERKLTRYMEIRDSFGNIRIDTKYVVFDMTEPAIVKINSQSAFKYDSTRPATRLDENDERFTWFTFQATDNTNARSDFGNKIPRSETSGIYQFRYRRWNIEGNGEWRSWQPYEDDTLHSEYIYWSKFIKDICDDKDKTCNPELTIEFQFMDRAGNTSNPFRNTIRYYVPKNKSTNVNLDEITASTQEKATTLSSQTIKLEYDLKINKNGSGNFILVKGIPNKDDGDPNTKLQLNEPVIDTVKVEGNKAILEGRAYTKDYEIKINFREQVKVDPNCNAWCSYTEKVNSETFTKKLNNHWMFFYKDGDYYGSYEVGANYINNDGSFRAELEISDDNNLKLDDWVYGKAKVEGALRVRGKENSNRTYVLDFRPPNHIWSAKSNYMPIRDNAASYLEPKFYSESQLEAGNHSNYYNPDQLWGMQDIKPGKNGSKFFDNIKNLIELGIVNGKSNGFYEEFNGVTRQEMAKFIMNGLSLSHYKCAKGQKYFTDVHEENKFKNEINLMACLGISNGYSDGTFRPKQLVTRGEAAKFLVLALGVKHDINITTQYANSTPIQDIYGDTHESNVFSKYIKVLKKIKVGGNEIMKGYSPASPGAKPDFKPINYITRGQMAKIIDLARQWHPNKQSEAIYNFEFSDSISDKTNIERIGPIEYHSCGAYYQEYSNLGQYGKSMVFVQSGESTAFLITGDILEYFEKEGGCSVFGFPTSAEWSTPETICGLRGNSQHFSKRQVFNSAAHTTSIAYNSELFRTFKENGYEQNIGFPIESYNPGLDDLFNDKFPEAADGYDGDAEWADGMRFEKGIIGIEQDPGFDDGYFADADFCEEVEEFIYDRIPWEEYILELDPELVEQVKHWGPSNLPAELEGYYEEGWEDTPVPMYNPIGGMGMEYNDIFGGNDDFGPRPISTTDHMGIDLRPTYFSMRSDNVPVNFVVNGFENTEECFGKKYTFDLSTFDTVTKSYSYNSEVKRSICNNLGWQLMQNYTTTKSGCTNNDTRTNSYDEVLIYASHDGIITDSIEGPDNLVCTRTISKANAYGYGRYATIYNPEADIGTLYAHFWVIFVEKGDFVRAGQPIGIMGNSGYSFGRHLHYEVCEKGDCSWSASAENQGSRIDPVKKNYLP